MAIRVAVHHETHYTYDRVVGLSPHVVRLRPAPHTRTPILAYSLSIAPKPHFLNWQQDPYGNHLARVVFPERAQAMRVSVDLVAEMTVINPFDFFLEAYAEKFPFTYEPTVRKELAPYLETLVGEAVGGKFYWLVETLRRRDVRTVDYLVEINRVIQQTVRYVIRMEPGVQTPEETLTCRSGSCRDSAWLQVQVLRHLGLAARFVSGYLIQLAADDKPLDGPSGPDRDFTDLHAWAEVYIPGAGWVGLDATSGLLTGVGHIPLACTAAPASAAPISGAVDKCESTFGFKMSVQRIYEDPRVTKPYTPEQWAAVEAAGQAIDVELEKGDVRLTMGGEPTFVSIDDMDGPEWNTAAMGPRKRELADELIKRLRTRFAPGGLLHYGQGKWYPGESLPRWALGCYWRKDGIPVWANPDLIADEEQAYGHGSGQAEAFIRALVKRLEVPAKFIVPAYEDTWYYLWKERRLPINVDPHANRLDNEEDRARLARVFEQGLTAVVGYALPLRPNGDPESRWESCAWQLRPERMYLLPGDSPMGFRLPLDSLAWVAESQRDGVIPRDPWEDCGELEDPRQRQRRVPGAMAARVPVGHMEQTLDDLERQPQRGESAPWIIRTALCVEPRGGKLHVFMPPVRRLEDYLDLVTQVEATAAELRTPVVMEGYTPPHDPRLNVLKVTPDPGVIEVNTHPARSWDELVAITMGLNEDARQSRLGTEKFMLDGRHTGTGGGSHIVVGGATPAESPFLRRPDLLKSMLGYWHNHPSLTYLFSSTFIGPTSQAPRVDEGRPESVYELEVAFRQIPSPEKAVSTPPWLVDRVFRNLLTDLTGNTHRAEFCIDKLYSPDSASGRLGLVELRGFEMPPHPQMNLAQQVLLRAMIARFWKEPYGVAPVRWGAQIHDRFMLPHFVAQDFADVIADLRAGGFPLEFDWFAPHLEFRFPRYGAIAVDGVRVELRQAIEPWNVLGEEPGGGGTVRYVDSSMERIQVKVEGLISPRHVIACNGLAIPLHPTGRDGEFVAGVRYRAWCPPTCLHPTIGVDSPLVLDVIDTWNRRAIGGCTYHVAHPGGRAFDTFPVNAFEAESRRVGRFFAFGHHGGAAQFTTPERSLEFPFTLDLRRQASNR